MVALLNTAQTLIMDLLPKRRSAVTGAVHPIVDCIYISLKHEQNNFVRCSLGAAMVSVIDPIITTMGEGRCCSASLQKLPADFNLGWVYVILGALCIAMSPLILLEVRMGPVWQRRRIEREG
jgi:hypothetical protein